MQSRNSIDIGMGSVVMEEFSKGSSMYCELGSVQRNFPDIRANNLLSNIVA